MPRYDYDCAACGLRFEVVHGVHGSAPEACPHCGKGPIRKAFAPPTIHFKGSGWAKKERRATSAGSSRASGDGDSAAASPSESAATGASVKETGETAGGPAASGSSAGAKTSTSTTSSSSADGGSAGD